MPKAIDNFQAHAKEIERLLTIHESVAGKGPGHKHDVEVLNKSAIVLITAFWEAFCEDLAAEALDHIVKHANTSAGLPKALRQDIARELKADKNDLAVWDVADDLWRTYVTKRMKNMTELRNRKLNTPKSVQITDLFNSAIGLAKISERWKWQGMNSGQAAEKLDKFVEMRGSIAHRGDAKLAVSKDDVRNYQAHVALLAERTQHAVGEFVSRVSGALFA